MTDRTEDKELVAIVLPRHALIYLVRILGRERDRVERAAAWGRVLDHEADHIAAFDNLRELEDSIPTDIWKEGQRP